MFSIPLPSWLQELLVAIVAMLFFLLAGYLYGQHKYHQGVKDQEAVQVQLAYKVDVGSMAVTNTIVGSLVPAQIKIATFTNTIYEKVPVYVTKEDDSKCPVPNGFVSLWNSANKMQLPNDPSGVPTGTSEVVLSDIATQHTREAGICLGNEQLLDSMKAWLLGQQKVYQTTR